MPEPRRDVRQLLEILAAHPVLPPAEALPANDDAFRDLLADLARGEDSSHAETLRAVSAALLVPAEELTRRVRFVLACLVLPPSGNHYEVLGLTRDASAQEIRKRWAALIQRYHPDRLGGSSWLDGQARRLIEAYQTLKDPRRRQEYDAELVAGPGRPLRLPVKRVVRMPTSLGSSRARWAPLGIAAVGVVVAGWAVLRPVPSALPRAPLPPAPRLLDLPAGAVEPRRATPPGPRGHVPDAGGTQATAPPPASRPAELPSLAPIVSGAAPAAPAPTADTAAAASPREPATRETPAAPPVPAPSATAASPALVAPAPAVNVPAPAVVAPAAPAVIAPPAPAVIVPPPAVAAPTAPAPAMPTPGPVITATPPVPAPPAAVPARLPRAASPAAASKSATENDPPPAVPVAAPPAPPAAVVAPAPAVAHREPAPPPPLPITARPSPAAPPPANVDGGPATARAAGPPARGTSGDPQVQAAVAPPASTAPPPGAPVARDELVALIERFRTAYERKDLDAVMGLFGAEPRERSTSGRINVQRLYARNFAALDGIRYELSDLEVVPGTDGHVVARGRFRIRAVRAGDPTQRVDTQGEIRWHVRWESGGLRISGIDYGVSP